MADYHGVSMKLIPWIGADRMRNRAKAFGVSKSVVVQSIYKLFLGTQWLSW